MISGDNSILRKYSPYDCNYCKKMVVATASGRLRDDAYLLSGLIGSLVVILDNLRMMRQVIRLHDVQSGWQIESIIIERAF